MPIPVALLAAIPSLIKAGAGVAQTIKANKLAKTQRPLMEVPPAEREALATARMLAYDSGMAGQNLQANKLQGSTASGVRAIQQTGRDSSEIINSIIGMYGAEQNAMNDLSIQGGNAQNMRLQQLIGQLGRMGSYQNQQFNTNQLQPYQENMAASSALRGAGAQNMFGALNDATNFALFMKMNPDIFGKQGGTGGAIGGDGSGGNITMDTVNNGLGTPGINPNVPQQRTMGFNIPGYTPPAQRNQYNIPPSWMSRIPPVVSNQMPYWSTIAK